MVALNREQYSNAIGVTNWSACQGPNNALGHLGQWPRVVEQKCFALAADTTWPVSKVSEATCQLVPLPFTPLQSLVC